MHIAHAINCPLLRQSALLQFTLIFTKVYFITNTQTAETIYNLKLTHINSKVVVSFPTGSVNIQNDNSFRFFHNFFVGSDASSGSTLS